MSAIESTPRFMRPSDLGRTRRNRRQLQARKILLIAANFVLAALIAVSCLWLYKRTQEDSRFAVRQVQLLGGSGPRSASLRPITQRYLGANLFKLDLNSVRADFATLPWVQRIAVEKKLPDTLVVRVFERQAVALLHRSGGFEYVDDKGVVFGGLTPRFGDDELPLVGGVDPSAVERCVRFLAEVRRNDPALYSRVSEVVAVDVDSFRIFDRGLRTFVFVNSDGSLGKWKTLYQLTTMERYEAGSVDYADLRFRDRIVLKRHDRSTGSARLPTDQSGANVSTQIMTGLGAAMTTVSND